MLDKKVIYIADDEINICNIIKSFLVKEGYNAKTFYDGQSLMETFDTKPADLLIIDIMMPGLDGYSICSYIRSKSSVPIIIVSARDSENDKIVGLSLGSDDYMTKPFSPMELVARIKSIFRRIELDKENSMRNNLINISGTIIDPDTKQAEYSSKNIDLTGMEFELLYYLAVNKNRAVSRSELLDRVWGFESPVETRATDDMIKRIRKKLADAGSELKIDTIWGYGFRVKDKE